MEYLGCSDILDQITDAVYYVDANRRILFWNKACEIITGFKKDEVIGLCCSDNILRHIDFEGNELCLTKCPLAFTLHDKKSRENIVLLHHKDGHRVAVEIKVFPILDERGIVKGAVEIFREKRGDDEKKIEIENLKKDLYIDELTEVYNRKYLNVILNEKLNLWKVQKFNIGVIFIDIDNFKMINDTYGHKVGDDILKMVSKSFKSAIRGTDFLIRWGGEEFLAILPNVNKEKLELIAERIRIFVEKSWIRINNKKISVTVSVGGLLDSVLYQIQKTIEKADQLMYQCKKEGKNRVKII